jgi:hypothetical protein
LTIAQEDLAWYTDRKKEFEEALQQAADVRAAAELAEQTSQYNEIKATRDLLKAEYDALVAADDAGTID